MYRSGLIELDAVVTVARLGGFRAAAVELGVSATSVSNSIAGLEARLGVRLFNRTTRSVSLSEAGERFIATVGPALSDIHAAMEATASQRGRPAGRLRLNCSVGAARQILVPVVLEFQKRYPDVRLDIVTDAHLVDIVAKGFDAGIRAREMVPEDMVSIPFGEDLRFVVVGSPAYLNEHPAPLKPGDLMAHRCIRTRWPSGAMYHWQFQKQGRELEIDVPRWPMLDLRIFGTLRSVMHSKAEVLSLCSIVGCLLHRGSLSIIRIAAICQQPCARLSRCLKVPRHRRKRCAEESVFVEAAAVKQTPSRMLFLRVIRRVLIIGTPFRYDSALRSVYGAPRWFKETVRLGCPGRARSRINGGR